MNARLAVFLFALGLFAAPEAASAQPACGQSPTSVTALDHVRIGSNPAGPNFQNAAGNVAFPSGPFASATLVVDLGSTCFPFTGWLANPPPTGQKWPADCDAFDRFMAVLLDGPNGVELIRAFTPFGGPLHLDVDVTDVVNGLPGAHQLQVIIPTLSDPSGQVSGSNGGWTVTARIDLVPGPAPRNVLAVLPLLYNTYGSTTGVLSKPFSVPAGTTATRLEYRATGVGGANDPTCSGPAEEFCQRTHHVRIDGADVQPGAIVPFRTDCASFCTLVHQDPIPPVRPVGFDYCQQNPTGFPASVNASRANWCPGSLTPPLVWDPSSAHGAGLHALDVSIDQVKAGGAWQVSAVLFAYGDVSPSPASAAAGGGPLGPSAGDLPLATAILPASRSVQVQCPATAFVTVINAGAQTATGVGIDLASGIAADFLYQTTNPATNAPVGAPNTPADIASGQAQTYVIAVTPTASLAPTDVAFTFAGSNTADVAPLIGLNTLLLSASATPIPDIVALAATAHNDGIVDVPGVGQSGAFGVATVNVGADGTITASTDTGTASVPVTIFLCQTNPATAQCLGTPAQTVTVEIKTGETPTFGIFVQADNAIAFDPARNRIFVRFKDGIGITRGATSVAVRTP